jgi:c-di-AMP phosphodiesterase-like protein
MIQITNTMIAIYSIIAVLTVVAAYIYGYTRAQRKSAGYVRAMQKSLDASLQNVSFWISKYDRVHREKVEWFSKYNALQQEIECTLHETHEEVERPHVDQDWWKSEEEFWKGIAQKNKEKETNIDHRYPEAGC